MWQCYKPAALLYYWLPVRRYL